MEKKKKEKKVLIFEKIQQQRNFRFGIFPNSKRFHVFDPSLIEIRKKKFDLFPSVLLSKFLSVSLSFIQAKEYIGQRRTIYHCPSSLRRSHEDRVKRMKISKTCSTVLKKVEGCRVTEEDGKLISPKGETKARIRTHFSLQ